MRPNDKQLQMSRQKMNGGHMTLQKPAGTDKSGVHKWTIKDPI